MKRSSERIPVIFEINDSPPCSSAQELADRIARSIRADQDAEKGREADRR